MRALRGRLSGYAIPQFMVDLPGGGGKVPLGPDYVVGRAGLDWVFAAPGGAARHRYRDVSAGESRPRVTAGRGPGGKVTRRG